MPITRSQLLAIRTVEVDGLALSGSVGWVWSTLNSSST
jgi:hypothetical protein